MSVAVTAAIAATAAGRSSVITFSKQDLAAIIAGACNSPYGPRGAVHVHRNSTGNMLYAVAEGEREAILFAQSQNCNELSSDTLNMWRSDADGKVVAQMAMRYGDRRLLIGNEGDGISGKRFDIERTGQFVVTSFGQTSALAAVNKAYRRLLDFDLDAQRIFLRQGGILIVGNNIVNKTLEAVPVRIEAGSYVAGAPIPVGNMPAGVRVLDYNEAGDELLLGGLNASGQTSFVTVDLATGQAAAVETAKPGDETGLFIADGALRARLLGGNPGAPQTSQQPAEPGQQPAKRRGFLGLFGRKE
ncbi:MAG: hypothetical protein ACR2IE_06365 [Candidatus Sumerlaeaceae bacterium]